MAVIPLYLHRLMGPAGPPGAGCPNQGCRNLLALPSSLSFSVLTKLVSSLVGMRGDGSKVGLQHWDSLLWDVLKAKRA